MLSCESSTTQHNTTLHNDGGKRFGGEHRRLAVTMCLQPVSGPSICSVLLNLSRKSCLNPLQKIVLETPAVPTFEKRRLDYPVVLPSRLYTGKKLRDYHGPIFEGQLLYVEDTSQTGDNSAGRPEVDLTPEGGRRPRMGSNSA